MANQNVHTGFWIDHSQNPVLGATITLDAVWGSQLISAAALVVQFVGAGIWSIIAFSFHQYRASPELREPDTQVQVLLRNTAGPDWAAWNIATITRQWWRREKRRGFVKEMAVLEVLAIVVYAGFLVAGIFVGFITLNQFGNSYVLLKPGACGFYRNTGTAASLNGQNHVSINISASSLQYARSCYGSSGSEGAISCSVYPVPSLGYTTDSNSSCPVPGKSSCSAGEDATPYTMTTNKIDSHYDLGINAPEKDRITYQYRSTCAPMAYDFVDSITKIVNQSDGGGGQIAIQQYFAGGLKQPQYSHQYLFAYAPIIRYYGINVVGYAVNAYHSYYPHSQGAPEGWVPAAPFNGTTTDLSLFFLTPNGVTFSGPVDDPMFRTYDTPSPDIYGPDRYLPERSVYIMACGEEWQFCNPNNDACTGFSGIVDIAGRSAHWTEKLAFNHQQNATYVRLSSAAAESTMFASVNGVPGSLFASGYLNTPTGSQPLPTGQWRTEVEGWFQTALAKMQYLAAVYVNIPKDALLSNDIELQPPDTAAAASQCSQQRVVSPSGYQSYSFVGLLIVAFFGLFVPLIAFGLKRGHRFFSGWSTYKRQSYEDEDIWEIYKRVSKQNPDSDEDDDDEKGDGMQGDGESVRPQSTQLKAADTAK